MGCFPLGLGFDAPPLTWYPMTYDPSVGLTDRNNQLWVESLYDNSLTPVKCTQACRDAGHQIAMLRDGRCLCGKDGFTLLTGSDPQPEPCDMPCLGDRGQICGGPNGQSVIYWDDSYKGPARYVAPAVDPIQDGGDISTFVGCFKDPNFYGAMSIDPGSTDNFRQCISPTTPADGLGPPTVPFCDRMCASEVGASGVNPYTQGFNARFGLPLSFGFNGAMPQMDPGTLNCQAGADLGAYQDPSMSVECYCSSMFGLGAYQVDPAEEPACRTRCTGIVDG